MDRDYYARYAYGSTRFCEEEDAAEVAVGAGPVGRLGDTIIRLRTEEPSIIFGGAGSGKGANLGIYQPVHDSTHSFFILDPANGQYLSTTWHDNLRAGREAYALNPFGVSAYSDMHHPLDLFGILKGDDYLFDNSRQISAMALTDSDSRGDNAWVGQTAQRWLTRMLVEEVCFTGCVKPNSLWGKINAIDANSDYLKALGRAAKDMPFDVYSTYLEIYSKKHTAEREYGAVMGKIKSDLDWLSSPHVADAISGDEDYLAALPDPERKIGIYFALPGGTGKVNQSLTRLVVGIAQLHCIRSNGGKRPLFYLEESATCGGADFMKAAASEHRKSYQTVFVYQSHGQLTHLFGQSGAQEILDSCGMQVYLGGGIRDPQSAKRLAEAIGRATIHVDDPMAQADRAYRAEQARNAALWHDADPSESLLAFEHEWAQSTQQRQAGRYALDPAELMRLRNQVVILTPGLGLPPILADKMPNYWQNPAMAGRYGPDPLFPPLDRVTVQRRFLGRSTRRFVRELVPEHLAHLPNHVNGEVAYVQGYRTWRGHKLPAGFPKADESTPENDRNDDPIHHYH